MSADERADPLKRLLEDNQEAFFPVLDNYRGHHRHDHLLCYGELFNANVGPPW